MSRLLFILVFAASSFSKTDYFNLISKGTQTEIEKLEQKIATEKQDVTQQAYLGAIKMKLAEFEKTPADKLKVFKAGKNMLEESIKSDSNNAEFRFLRLIIQENAPKVLKYNSQISTDADFVKANFDKLPKDVKAAATNYAASSPTLKL